MYIAYDSIANSANHTTFLVPTYATWTMPFPLWLGSIAAVRNAGDGTIIVTELQ